MSDSQPMGVGFAELKRYLLEQCPLFLPELTLSKPSWLYTWRKSIFASTSSSQRHVDRNTLIKLTQMLFIRFSQFFQQISTMGRLELTVQACFSWGLFEQVLEL